MLSNSEIAEDIREQNKRELNRRRRVRAERCVQVEGLKAGDKVKIDDDPKTYEYGYISGTGHIIVYNEGERNMQDSHAIEPEKVCKLPETNAAEESVEDKFRTPPFKVGESERLKWVSSEVEKLHYYQNEYGFIDDPKLFDTILDRLYRFACTTEGATQTDPADERCDDGRVVADESVITIKPCKECGKMSMNDFCCNSCIHNYGNDNE